LWLRCALAELHAHTACVACLHSGSPGSSALAALPHLSLLKQCVCGALPCRACRPCCLWLDRSWARDAPTQPPSSPTLLFTVNYLEEQLKAAVQAGHGGQVQ